MKLKNKIVSIVNRTGLINFGSVLQVYALHKSVENLGYNSQVLWQKGNFIKGLDIRPIKILKTLFKILFVPDLLKYSIDAFTSLKKKNIDNEVIELFNDFVKENIKVKLLSQKELIQYANDDNNIKFICGSDQVWSSTNAYIDPLMYLRFVPESKRIAYAPSIGKNYIPKYNEKQMREYINDIPYVSIREKEGQKLIKELTGRDVPVVADPTLLLNKEHWDKLINTNIKISKPYILCYFLDWTDDNFQNQIEEMAKKNNLDIVVLGKYKSNYDRVYFPKAGPKEFLTYVKGAEFIFSDSFHCILFSMIFNKNFNSLERQSKDYDQSSRQLSILETAGLETKYIKTDSNINLSEIDYKKISGKLDCFVEYSKKYLTEALLK